MLVTSRPLPQQDQEKVLLHAKRFVRASDALRQWSETAKKSVDYFEGRQWSAADIAKLKAEKRPALTLNKIRPLVNLVIGYFLNQQSTSKFLPGYDGSGTASAAEALTLIDAQISELNQMPFVDTEVFIDGLLTGRGFYRDTICFEKNDLGEVVTKAQDNFSTYLDPDADDYDVNSGSHITLSRMISPEEVGFFYGEEAVSLLGPFMQSAGMSTGMPSGYGYSDEVSPLRRFSREADEGDFGFGMQDYMHDFVDVNRKNVRLLDIEHYVRVRRWFFVDLETGSSRPVPDNWTKEQIDRALFWAQENGAPMVVQQRAVRRLRSTHMIGNVLVYDAWSKYDTMSVTGFFPYFRRGMTQGMVEHLLDAQDEHNKRRSARLNIIGRSSAGGWQYPKGSLDAQQKANLEQFGSTPGFHMEYDTKGGTLPAPTQIQPATTPVAMTQAENDAEEDLKKISGINDASLGMVDQAVMSGAALERRQRQTIVGLEHYLANFKRTKELQGRKRVELVQGFYTEQRIIRKIGKGNNPVQMMINQRTAAGIINDVTVGSFAVVVDAVPLSKSFMEAQFEELLNLKSMGMPIPDEFLIDASSVTRKEELKVQLAQARALEQAAAQMGHNGGPPMDDETGGPGPGGSRVGADGGSMPSGPEPGAPPPGM